MPAGGATASADNINDVLDGHVALEVEYVDRVYLNADVPCLQVGPQVNKFLEGHLGNPIRSPGLDDQGRRPGGVGQPDINLSRDHILGVWNRRTGP